jgi:hypothetical protein
MDPLDRQLTAAGAAWREAQPIPPDLDRMVARLEIGRSRRFSSRFAFVLVAGLLLISAVAVAPGVGSFLHIAVPPTSTTPAPSVSATPGPSEAPSTAPTPAPSNLPILSGAERATALVESYQAALVGGDWQAAFALLAPASPTKGTGLAAYSSERAAFYDSVAGRTSVGTPTRDVPDWSVYDPLIEGADTTLTFLVEVDYPALAGNNAGYEQFVVGPDTTGTWWIWPVR